MALWSYCFIHWKNIANIALDPVTQNLTLTYYPYTTFENFPPDDEPIPRNLGSANKTVSLPLHHLAENPQTIAAAIQQQWQAQQIKAVVINS